MPVKDFLNLRNRRTEPPLPPREGAGFLDIMGPPPVVFEGRRQTYKPRDLYQEMVGQLSTAYKARPVREIEGMPSLDWLDKVRELNKDPEKLLPFISSGVEIFTLGKLLKSASDLEAGREVSKEDLLALKEYVDHAQKDKTWGYQVADVVAQLVPFAGEFIATGGIYAIGQKAAVKGSTVALKKLATKTGARILEGKLAKYGIEAAGVLAGGTLRTVPAGTTRIPAKTIEKQLQTTLTGDEESVWESARKAFGEQWVEVVSESTGGLFKPLLAPIKGQMVKIGLFKAFAKANPSKNANDVRRVFNKFGFHGVLEEMLEERMADVGHGVLEPLGLSDQKFSIPSLQQLSVELVAFSIPGVAMKALETLPTGEILAGERGGIRLPKPEGEIPNLESTVRKFSTVDEFTEAWGKDYTANFPNQDKALEAVDKYIRSRIDKDPLLIKLTKERMKDVPTGVLSSGNREIMGKQTERWTALYKQYFEELKGKPPPLPEGEIPKVTPEAPTPPTAPIPVAEPGEPEAGLQTGMMGVPAPEITPTEGIVPAEPTIPPETAPAALEPGREGIPPTVPPPPIETGITTEPPSVEPSGRISFANLQDAQTVIDYSTKPDISRWIANLPLVRNVMAKVSPVAIADTPGQKAIIARAVMREEGNQKAQGVISFLNELGNQEKVFGQLDDNGFIASGKLKGLAVNDIRTYPKKYADKLTMEQKEWVDRAHEIEAAKLKFMRDNGVEVKELTFEEGGEYAGRRVYAKMSADGELLDSAYVGAGPSRIGKKTAFEKHRVFNTAKDALNERYKLLPDDEALSLNVRAAYNRVADKQMADWLLSQVPWRTNGAPEELVLAAESAKSRSHKSKQLLASLNRALRGERGVPEQTINSIKGAYQKEVAELQGIIADIRTGKPTAEMVQAFEKKVKAIVASDKADMNAAINARARARERAMTPRFGESALAHPAFSGKIFTGSEARELADTMRQALEPNVSKTLASVNKVNALVRYFKLAGDFSPLGIQLIFLSGQNPRIYGGAAASIPKLLFNKEFHDSFISSKKAVIDRHPGLLLSKSGTEFTEAMAKGGMLSTSINILPRQESFLKNLELVVPRTAGKIGATVLQPFQRVFEGTVDYAGIKMAESLEHLAKTPAEMAEVDQFINEFRGLTSSAKLGVSPNWRAGETATLLAPRYNRAIASLLADAVKGSVTFGQSGIRNRLAIQGLTKGIAAISAMAVAISLALGQDWDEIAEHFDPNSPEFFTWLINGTRIGPGTKVRSVIKLVAQSIAHPDALFQNSMENPALRFSRGNLAPVPGGAIDILTGRNYIGDPVRSDTGTFTKEMLVKNFMPIWVENVVYEGGNLSQKLLRGAGEFFGGRAYPETTKDTLDRIYDRYAAQDLGKNVDGLNKLERSQLEQRHPDLAAAKADNEKYWSDRGDNVGIALDIEGKKLDEAMNESLEKAAQKYLDGAITKYDYDKNRSYIRPYTSGGKSALWSLRETLEPREMKQYEKWYEENAKPEDKAYDDFQEYRAELIEKAELPKDWDIIDREIEAKLKEYSPGIQMYIQNRQDDKLNKLPPAARKVEQERAEGIENETWWDNYRGASALRAPYPGKRVRISEALLGTTAQPQTGQYKRPRISELLGVK